MNKIILRSGSGKSVLHRHPWIFSGAVAKTEGNPAPGEIVDIFDRDGRYLARGYYNPESRINVRILEWREGIEIDRGWWEAMIKASVSRRDFIKGTDALRLVFAEADLLPGLIVDMYGRYAVMQALTAGIEAVKGELAGILYSCLDAGAVIEKNDDVRSLEGLPPSSGILEGGEVPEAVVVTENGLKFIVDPLHGQKTGFYMDQRDNRLITASYAGGMEVLDCFSYTGGFTVSALRAGAKKVTSVDSSAEAVELLKENIKLNGIDESLCTAVRDDAFTVLRAFRDEGRLFDMAILDPPKFAPSKFLRDKAMRAYKDINLLAMKVLKPGGLLVTFSCSGGISPSDFRLAVSWASIDAKREVQIIRTLSQAGDHPVRLSYPESEYLKGLICRVL